MRAIVTLVFLFPSFAHADTAPFKSIHCLDANSGSKAPVFLDVETGVPGTTGERFELGNIVPTNIQPGQTFKDSTAMGDVTVVSSDQNKITLSGSFGLSAEVDIKTGLGLVSGPLKYDPATGEYVTYSRVRDYAVKCIIQSEP